VERKRVSAIRAYTGLGMGWHAFDSGAGWPQRSAATNAIIACITYI